MQHSVRIHQSISLRRIGVRLGPVCVVHIYGRICKCMHVYIAMCGREERVRECIYVCLWTCTREVRNIEFVWSVIIAIWIRYNIPPISQYSTGFNIVPSLLLYNELLKTVQKCLLNLRYATNASHTHTHTRLTAFCPGLPRWAGTRKVKPIWILLKQERASGSGISWAMCKSAHRSRQITMPAPHHSPRMPQETYNVTGNNYTLASLVDIQFTQQIPKITRQ